MWIGSAKNNKTKPLGVEFYHDAIKSLGVNLSYNQDKNKSLNFFIIIYKMDAKLNMWQTSDLTLFGRTILDKALGISKLVYAASLLCVPDTVIKTVQLKIFKFLWKNKKDHVKPSVVYQPLSRRGGGGGGGGEFSKFHTIIITTL